MKPFTCVIEFARNFNNNQTKNPQHNDNLTIFNAYNKKWDLLSLKFLLFYLLQ